MTYKAGFMSVSNAVLTKDQEHKLTIQNVVNYFLTIATTCGCVA
jgi:hypothetical protein